MGKIRIRVDTHGLLDYAKAGRDAEKQVRKAVGRVLNAGRKTARREISSEFEVQTGYLRRQARRMQTSVKMSQSEVKGRVAPLPRLLNIFEHGANLDNGRGYLRPRPVVQPAKTVMEQFAPEEFERLVKGIGK